MHKIYEGQIDRDWCLRCEMGGRKKRKKKSKGTQDDSLVFSQSDWENFSSPLSTRFLSFFYFGCPSKLKKTPSQLVLKVNIIGFWFLFCVKRTEDVWLVQDCTTGQKQMVLRPRSDGSQHNPKPQILREPHNYLVAPLIFTDKKVEVCKWRVTSSRSHGQWVASSD